MGECMQLGIDKCARICYASSDWTSSQDCHDVDLYEALGFPSNILKAWLSSTVFFQIELFPFLEFGRRTPG